MNLASSDTAKPRLLLIDDDPLIGDSLGFALSRHFEVLTSPSRPHCRTLLAGLAAPPAIAIVDLGLPPTPHRPDEGFALIGELLAAAPGIRIIVLSGQNDEDNARHARTLGAIDFVAKPCDPGRLLELLQRALRFQPQAPAPAAACTLIGESPAMQRLRQQITQFANFDYPVLIEGESGSGKDVVATCCLHKLTRRSALPFLALNCAAISPGLLEPTLFGHARGAFTGATGQQAGYFEEAGEGTLFLDEIGELPPELQPKLLRVLENGEYQRVGETQRRSARARIIAATNRDLKKEIKAGRFRADLYHRLSVFTIQVPPLRDMEEDRLRLFEHFRHLFAAQAGTSPVCLDDDATALWRQYGFPGNVRELRNIVVRLTAKHPGQRIDPNRLLAELDVGDEPPRRPDEPANTFAGAVDAAERFLREHGAIDLDRALAEWERAYIEAALKLAHGNVSQAARSLGINRTTLYNRMENWTRE